MSRSRRFAAVLVLLIPLARPAVLPAQPPRIREAGPAPLEIPQAVQSPDLSRFLFKNWSFEDGTLQGFQREDQLESAAFDQQPVFGDAVTLERALNTDAMALPADPCAGLADLRAALQCATGAPGALFGYLTRLRGDLIRIREDLQTVGGGYAAATSFPIGQKGLYWIGTAERRFGNGARGRLVSPEIELQQDFFHLLVGGGCSDEVGVYLQTKRTVIRGLTEQRPGALPGIPSSRIPGGSTRVEESFVWETLKDSSGRPIVARGYCIENMVRVSFDIRHLRGTKARILIEDLAIGAWGHLNVDDIWLADAPRPSSRETDPVWGVADLHAHLMNERSYTAFGADGRTPEARALWGSALGPIESLGRCNDTHTTDDDNYHSHQDEGTGTTYTLCRDLCLNQLEGAGLHDEHHDTDGGYPRFAAWPMWYSAIHQQMHWTWVQRAFQGGLRLMIATVGNSEVISFALAKEKDRTFTSDQAALARQIPAIQEFARQNASWAEVAYTPRDVRRIMNSGKLAIIIGVELDHVMDNCNADVMSVTGHRAVEYSHPDLWASQTGYNLGAAGVFAGIGQFLGAQTRIMHYPGHPRTCTPRQIEARLDALYRQGVRHILPMHFSDNMLGGYAISGDLFVASAIFGDPGARPPTLMAQAELTARYGSSVAPFVPVKREAYVRQNEAREAEWRRRLPFEYKLPEVQVPIWARLSPDILMSSIVPPGPGRSVAQFFTGQCIEDPGWRAFAAFASLGASEATCSVTTLTQAGFEAARTVMPYEGATDSAAIIPFDLMQQQRDLPFHVNARGLTGDGEIFLRQMMRRGMLIDLQHASENAKDRMLEITGTYPVMASHGGVATTGSQRANENVLSISQLRQVYAPPNGWVGGLVGIGTQSSVNFIQQIRAAASGGLTGNVARQLQIHGVALGTDLNGFDWHSAPRFGHFAHPSSSRFPVNYSPYPAESNPWATPLPAALWLPSTPLHPHQITQDGRVTRTFDINFDGLAHYGMIPDFLQELVVLGATREEMGTLFRSAEALVRMWEESCRLAYAMPSPPASLGTGCGARSSYP